MTSLAEFLLARIAEDQAEQTTPEGGRYGLTYKPGEWHRADCEMNTYDAGPCDCGTPARVLAECEAKRQIITAVEGWHHAVVEDCWYTCPAATEEREGGECCDDLRRGTECDCGRDHRVLMILAPLASVYSSHPDYRDEWRHDTPTP